MARTIRTAGLVLLLLTSCSERQAASPPGGPATCESAGDRYIELYKQEARASGQADRADDDKRLARKRQSFVDDCAGQVASGVMKPEHLTCAVQAATIEAGKRCFPKR